MKKIKLFLAACAAMVSVGVQAGADWTAPSAPTRDAYSTEWATPTSGETYYIYNVGAGTFLGGGRNYGTRTISTINNVWVDGDATITPTAWVDYALPFTLQKNEDGTWYLIHKGTDKANKYMFYEPTSNGSYIDNNTTHAGSKWNIVSTDNGYRLDMNAKSGQYFGVHATNLVSSTLACTFSDFANAESDKWIYWQFVPESEGSAIKTYAANYFNEVALYNAKLAYAAKRETALGFVAKTDSYTDETGAAATLTNAVYAQDDVVDAATTVAEIETAGDAVSAATITFLSSIIITSGFDITDVWITNSAPYANGDGWTATNGTRLNDWASNPVTYDSSNQCAEMWSNTGATFKQTLSNLPAGAYQLTAIAFTRTGYVTTLSAGESSMSIATVSSSEVNGRDAAKTWFDNGNGVNNLNFQLNEDTESLEIGLTTGTTGDAWTVWRSFTLTYYGDPINLAKANLTAAVATAEAYEGIVPTAVYSTIAAAITANDKTYDTVADYDAATAAINAAVSANATTAIIADYARYQSVKAAALGIAAETSTTDADAAVNAATTTAAIDAAVVTLRAAFQTALASVDIPADPGYIDVTAVMVDNASVSTNTNYWTKEGTPNGGYSFGVCNYGECEFYLQNFKFYQTLAMSTGTWEFGVTGFHRAGNHSTYFYAGDDKILIPGVESDVVNSMAEAKTYFDNGNGKVSLKFGIEEAGNVEIGIDNQDTQTDKWTIFRDFTLKYYGSAVDYSIYTAAWSDALAAANAAKEAEANVNVTGAELTALNDAIADAPDGSSKANYIEKTNALTAATSAFTAAAASYDAYVAYKAETVALFGSDLDVAAPATAAEAVTAVQNLNIAQYNKVATDYPYSLTSKIGDFSSWTGTATLGVDRTDDTPNYLSWAHYSGVAHAYYEQCSVGYENAGGWTIQYTKTTTLPAGSYVVKVAARSSAGVTSSMSCSATDVTISLPCAGDNTRGINTSGVASWSDDDEFITYRGTNNTPAAAVGNSGAGWQWRFLPFTLEDETEVTMTFYAEASSQYQWMSIADGELLSAENIATAVAYDEVDENTITAVDVANVTITRKVKEGFNTVVLPFDLTAAQVEAAFGTGTQVYAFSENGEADAENITINFNKVDAGTISANVPVLVKATKASESQVFEGVEVKVAESATVEGTNANFVGVYAPATVAAGDYFIGNGAVYKSAGNTSIKAFRAYIDVDNEAAGEIKVFIDGITTSISEINGVAESENGAIFNLAGQRVSKAQRGIYIVNGKKVAVK